MNYGENLGGASDAQTPDWQILMQKIRGEAPQETKDAPDDSADKAIRDCAERLPKEDAERLLNLSSEIDRLGRKVSLFDDEPFFQESAIASLKKKILPPESSTLDNTERVRAMLNRFEPVGPRKKELRESRIQQAIDYMQIRDGAEQRLEQYIVEHESDMSEVTAAGLQEMGRILRPQQGDDFTRLHFVASMLADGEAVDASSMMRGVYRNKNREQHFEEGATRLEARIFDLGCFHILKEKIAAKTGRQDIDDTTAADILVAKKDDAVMDFLMAVDPLRLDLDRSQEPDWGDRTIDMSSAPDADVSNLCDILAAYDKNKHMYVGIMARQYGVNDMLALSQEETQNISGFVVHVGETLDGAQGLPEDLTDRLTQLGNALVVCAQRSGDVTKMGPLVRENGATEGTEFFDTAFEVAQNDSEDIGMRTKKLRIMLNMALSGMLEPGQVSGLKGNLFPALERGDEDAQSLVDDEFLPNGAPNPDVDKNWTRGFGLGLSDYKAKCYVMPATPKNIHELILQHDSLPSLNAEQYFQNREDARVLGTDDQNTSDGCIFYSRDFIHNQMPHSHEALVYQWAYQKIGRGESFSEEESKMLAQIGKLPPAEDLSDEQRKELLDSLGDEYLGFLERNKELTDVILGPVGYFISDADLAEGEDPNNISEATIRLGHKRALEKFVFNMDRYDTEVQLLDTTTNTRVTEKVSDILWRLVKNTDSLTIEAPKTGDEELDGMLAGLDLSINEKGECPIELRDLAEVMPAINSRLIAMRGKREMSPSFIAGLSYLSRAANLAVKDLPPKELRELFYDQTFKEIVRFHSLTWQKGQYSESEFDTMWHKFSDVRMEDDDQTRIDHYAVPNRMILNQSESLVRMYSARAVGEHLQAEALEAESRAPRYDGLGMGSQNPYLRAKVELGFRSRDHERQANMYSNFANSVWSLNLSSTLAKIGHVLP